MPDRYEDPITGDFTYLAGPDVLQLRAGHAFGLSVPMTSSSTLSQMTFTFGCAKRRFCRMRSALNSLRR